MANTQEALLTNYLTEEQARFYRLAYSYLHNRDEALDAVQTAVCRAWEQQDRLRDPDAVHTWFYRILTNVCLDQLRRRKRVTLVAPEDLDAGSYEDPLPADGSLQKQALFSIGLVLFVFIMLINWLLNTFFKRGEKQ